MTQQSNFEGIAGEIGNLQNKLALCGVLDACEMFDKKEMDIKVKGRRQHNLLEEELDQKQSMESTRRTTKMHCKMGERMLLSK